MCDSNQPKNLLCSKYTQCVLVLNFVNNLNILTHIVFKDVDLRAKGWINLFVDPLNTTGLSFFMVVCTSLSQKNIENGSYFLLFTAPYKYDFR